jgi:hypothetical protein
LPRDSVLKSTLPSGVTEPSSVKFPALLAEGAAPLPQKYPF